VFPALITPGLRACGRGAVMTATLDGVTATITYTDGRTLPDGTAAGNMTVVSPARVMRLPT
jgi:hypothetical protein